MFNLSPIEPVDYLIIGHLTQDLASDSSLLGGTATYAGLTAKAFGWKVGIVTSTAAETDLSKLDGIPVASYLSDYNTTFENINTATGRIQYLHHTASRLDLSMVPETWRNAKIVHLGPVAQEVEPTMIRAFPDALIGITPQGWLRSWDKNKRVHPTEWPEASFVLQRANAAVLSIEDVQGNEDRIEEMVSSIRILVVTEGEAGCRLYWNGDLRRFQAPPEVEVDSIGAGDIFAASFFSRLYTTRDPWEAARFATQLASLSVTRAGLSGIPTTDEIKDQLYEIVNHPE